MARRSTPKRLAASETVSSTAPLQSLALPPLPVGSPTPGPSLAQLSLVEDIPTRPEPGEMGFTGTPNWSGEPLAETNTSLLRQLAYGQPGARSWGEWEKLQRTDPDIAVATDFTLAQIRDARVDIEEADEEAQPDRALATAQADFVRWCLLQNCEPGWSEVLQQMGRCIVPGFALHEICWGDVTHKSLPGGAGLGITKLAERLPVSVHVNGWLERDGDLYAVKQLGMKSVGVGQKWEEVILPAEKLSLVTWNRTGSNYLGYSAFRPAWYIAKIREHMLKVIGIGVVREAAGIPTATAKDPNSKLTQAQRKRLQVLLANLVYHENASVVMPAGWDLNWVFSPAANKGHVLDAWTKLGEVILRLLSAQGMALGVNGTGSRAVGQSHQGIADTFVQGLVAIIEGAVNGVGKRQYTGLIRKLCEANWGPQQGGFPVFKVTLKKPQLSPLEKAQAAQAFKGAGLLTPMTKDENVIREDLGLETITEDERQEAKEKAAALAPQILPGAPHSPPGASPSPAPLGQTSPQGKPGLSPRETPPSREAKTTARAPRAQQGPFVPSRPLRASEKRLDLQRMDTFLAGGRARFERLIRPAVAEMLVHAQPELVKALEAGQPKHVHSIALKTDGLVAAIEQFLDECRAEGFAEVKAELRTDSGQDVADARRDGKVTAAASDEEDDKGAEDAADEVQEQVKDRLVRKVTQRLQGELEDEAIDAARTGAEPSLVISRTLTSQLDTGAFRADAGVAMTRLWNVGRDEAARMLGGVASVERSAILDDATCGPCEEMDGETADFDSPEHDALLPPEKDCEGGASCRCCVVYVPASSGSSEGDE